MLTMSFSFQLHDIWNFERWSKKKKANMDVPTEPTVGANHWCQTSNMLGINGVLMVVCLYWMAFYGSYPLVMTHIATENHHFPCETRLFLWQFSIAMLNSQKVRWPRKMLLMENHSPYSWTRMHACLCLSCPLRPAMNWFEDVWGVQILQAVPIKPIN